MSHEILGDRFYSLRQPAWHALGTVSEDELSALPALKRIGGSPKYSLEKVASTLRDGTVLDLEDRIVVRHPIAEDPEYIVLGHVSPDYRMVTPTDVCTVWDEFVAKPVETMGFLRGGSNFFLTSKLPAIDVKGDEVEMYLGATTPMKPGTAATTEIWPLRVVCANTLRMAQSDARDVYRVVHDETARERMGTWLADMYGRAEAEVALMREAFDLLAGHTVRPAQRDKVLLAAYPEPTVPRHDAPDQAMESRIASFEYSKSRQLAFRTKARELFDGEGKGMDTPAAAGTLWGLWNSVVELEDYRKGWNKDGNEAAISAENALYGERRRTKERAFAAAAAIAS